MKKYLQSDVIQWLKIKLDLKMKITAVFVLAIMFNIQANSTYSQKTKISLYYQDISTENILDVIEQTTDFRFVYKLKDVNLQRRLSIHVIEKPITEVLSILFDGTDTGYKIRRSQVMLKKGKPAKPKVAKTVEAVVEDLQQSVSGSVTNQDGEPLPGASVVEKGTNNGTQTDFDGNFTLTLSSDSSVILVSYIGYKTQEVNITEDQTPTITLEDDAAALDVVVVTAIGIERSKRALGYSVEEVQGEEIANSGSSNVLTSLQGKGAGISITNTSSGVTGSTEIVLRGGSSLTGSNGALIVVDGVPFSNRSLRNGGDLNVDFGSGIADLNAQDIESISVLKGANAAALYGSRALNGVVMITTKRGQLGEPQFSFSSQLKFTEIMYFPELQNEYGAGHGNVNVFGILKDDNGQLYTGADTNYDEKSWGPKLNQGLMVRRDWLRDRPILPWVSHGEPWKDFFQTSLTNIQNLNITGGTEALNYYLSFLYEDAEDVQPESTQDRYNLTLRLGSQINENVGLEGRLSYTYSQTHNRLNVGSRESVYYTLLQMPRSISLDFLTPHRYPFSGKEYSFGFFRDGNKVAWNRSRNNPYWTVYEDPNDDKTKRLIGFTKLNLNLIDDLDGLGKLTAFARIGWDNSEVDFKTIRGRSEAYTKGNLSVTKNSYLELNTDFYITYQKSLGDLGLTANFGGNRRYNETDLRRVWGWNFLTDERVSSNNLENREFASSTNKQALNSLYGGVQFAYKNYLFLDITGRNDWSSTLPLENNSFFYPSASLGFVVTDALKGWNSNILQYAKLRASYAEVGNDLGIYRINTYYNYGTDGQGRLQATVQNSVGNQNIEAEVNKSLEFGADLRFLENRIGLDVTWYQSATENQIIDNYPQAISTGFTNLLYNVGKISNTGIEVSLFTSPIRTENLNWDLTLNYATNEMVLEELNLPGEAYFRIEDHIEYSARAYVGEKFGDIYGYRYLRDNEGTVIVNEQGYPIIDNLKGSDSEVKVGNIQPDFSASIQSSLNYKNLSFSFLIDGSFGGDVFSGTKRELNRNGYSKESLQGRDDWTSAIDNDPRNLRQLGNRNVGSPLGGYDRWVGKSIFGVFDASGLIMLDSNGHPMTGLRNEGQNAMYVNPERYWGEAARQGYRAVAGSKDGDTEEYLEDGTFIKLREVSLTYDIPPQWFEGTGLEQVRLSLVGRNLFYFNDVSDFFDPDSYRRGTNINSLGYERNGAFPSMRTYLLNLSINF
ncbi:MAG: SusC/RagA family TonB-linked outer membrane protein [Flavobacteriaceae bacterium]|nr:SusC/RagA family TonB-linked outer membrane protein [Flavobacteriaceae bacterium]